MGCLSTAYELKWAPLAMEPREANAGLQILTGWKEIADYLGKGVRTVQRYERELQLPIHRPAGKSYSSVVAFKLELDRWAKGIPLQVDQRTMRLREEANRIAAQFLQVDAEVALTLSGMALKAHSGGKERQSRAARRAYDTITQLRRKFDFNETENHKLDASLHRLRNELRQLGKL